MALHWNIGRIRRHMKRLGIQNASQLAAATGMTKPTAARILADGRLERIDAATLEALAAVFGMKPGALIVRNPPATSAPSGS